MSQRQANKLMRRKRRVLGKKRNRKARATRFRKKMKKRATILSGESA